MATQRQSPQVVRFGVFEVDLQARELRKSGLKIKIHEQPFQILSVLLERAGEVVTRHELRQRIWPVDTFVDFDHSLSTGVNKLREALGDSSDNPRFVETVPRRGYRFLGSVEQIGNAASRPWGSPWPRTLYWIATALAGVLLTTLMVGILRERTERGVKESRIESVAVLPLESLSSDAAQDYFALGMTDALITDLGKIAALRVISRSAVMKYKGHHKPAAEIASELKVQRLVEGSVLRSQERVRITARLIEPATEATLWSETYERELGDVIALEREVARSIANEVRVKLTAQEQVRLGVARTVRPEVYDSYLRGTFLASHNTKADNLAAIEAFERAIAADATFAAAYAAVAKTYVRLFFFFKPEERRELEEKAYIAVEKALSLDPDLADAYIVRGRFLWTPANHFPHERAIQEFRHALALNQNSADGHMQLALIYNHTGLLDKALEESRKAAEIDPSSAHPLLHQGHALAFQGKYEEALAVYRTIPMESFPTVVATHTAWMLFQLGRRHEASAMIDESSRDYPEDPAGGFAGIQALLAAAAGDTGRAEGEIARALQKKSFGHFHHTAYWIACAYARMNKSQSAMDSLQQAAENGFPCYPLFERDPNLNPLRHDPRFIAFLVTMKKQWEHYNAML
jgi:TolB-like protein/DNA-binding winged helix-turn-helix (wHTH) protein/Flp pilus assembly protein TadD